MNMRLAIRTLFALLALCASLVAQTTCSDANVSCSSVPRLIRFTGVLLDSAGHPRSGTVGVAFSVYSQATGGTPLWQETQNVSLDAQGHYGVLLGMTKTEGMPVEVFSSPESRWLGVWPQLDGEQEHSRVVLVSVPYALKAADTETLQGLPASAFVRAPISTSGRTAAAVPGSSSSPSVVIASGASATSGSAKPPDSTVTTPGGAVNAVPKFGAATSIVNSQITDSNGVVGMQNLANILFADQFPGGVPDAVKACPAPGCVIYAYSPAANLNLGSFDPGQKAITLYLGPYTYSVTQITLEDDLKIIGMGAGVTTLQSAESSMPVFVVPQHIDGAAQHVLLSGFSIHGATGNTTQDAILLDSSGYYNSGIWYSELHDIIISGFGGMGIYIKGTNAGFNGISQFTEFNRVVVFRPQGGGNALRIEGGSYELYFNDCEFDGSGDGTNIFIGGRAPNRYAIPIDINFRGLTSQNAATAVEIDGGWALSFYSPHHEFVRGVYSVATDLGPVAGLTISDAGFQTSGTNNGAGYLLRVLTPGVTGIRFIHNHIMGPADTVVSVPNGVSMVYQDNLFYGGTDLPVTSGITTQITAASTINIGAAHTVGLLASSAVISTIQANLGAGETATFYATTGPVTFASGGNINLMGAKSITVNGSITFVVSDLGNAPSWVPISQWGPPSSAPNFALSSSEQTLTLAAGTKGTADLTLTPENGFSGNVDLSCAGGSPDIGCSIIPNMVSVNGSNAASATLSIASTLNNTSSGPRFGGFQTSFLALFSFGCVGSVLLPLFRPNGGKQVRWLTLIAGLFLVVLGSVGCGTPAVSQGANPTHYYFPIVTATSGSHVQTLIFSVTVP
jgi:hypothetical protein